MWSTQSAYLCLCIEDKACSHTVTVPCPGSACGEGEAEQERQVVKKVGTSTGPGLCQTKVAADYLTDAGSPVLIGNRAMLQCEQARHT